MNPNDANTRFWHAARLAAAGRFEESIAEASRGRQLDPVSPIITAGVSWMNHFARKHEQAAAMAVATMAIEPDFVIAHARRGVAFKHLGDYGQAAVEMGRCLTLSPDNPDHLAQLGQIHALQGRRDAAHQVIARLKQLAGTRFVPAYDLALVHAALGSATPQSNGPDGLHETPIEAIAPGDHVLVPHGEVVPVDGTAQTAATIDVSTLTGESMPVGAEPRRLTRPD